MTDRPSDIGADPSIVRAWNERLVLRVLRSHGSLRISELAAHTGLTAATLRQVLAGLGERDWVQSESPTVNGRGRPARAFRLRAVSASVLGLDVGAHAVRGVRLHLDGTEQARHEVVLDDTTQERRQAAMRVVAEALGGPDSPEVWMHGLAVGGALTDDGRVLRSVAVPEFEGLNPLDLFADALPGPGVLTNDVRAATWAESVVGVARGVDEFLLVHLGRRPTFGVFVGADVRRGAHGTAGDMSLSTLLPADESIGDLVAATLAGDVAASQRVRDYASGITPALASAAALLDPEVLVIAGAMAPVAGLFMTELVEHLAAHVQRPPRVQVSALDQFATALGAGHLVLRELHRRLTGTARGILPLARESLLDTI